MTHTTEHAVKNTSIGFCSHEEHIFPTGTLDKGVKRLILISSDSGIFNKILRTEQHNKKQYLVR
ncbi:hypothetical protein FUT69_04635 [Xylella taiwanensis]|nr:hypothetical protein [Xylella taiwanensis]MCD8455671.1 hypothetical protein [Xylella taiwanensis]MCD8458079.1 hypothetical protein [Xylella taiwanensis]MCD8460214.1 hypothetical protein [Xylella taiwanensis]MCD8463728.1 hypothetical protein [Xylella taiwanensis]MCD8464716.1 hypothetical protein [Xylella taiwanensis]